MTIKAKKILTKALGWLTADGVSTKIVDGKLAVCTGIDVTDGVATVYLTEVRLAHDESPKGNVNKNEYVTPFEVNAKVVKGNSYQLTITDVSVVEAIEGEAIEGESNTSSDGH